MNQQLSFNPFQTAIALLQPKYNYFVSGRGMGKSTYFGFNMHQIVNYLPGASAVIAAKTFTHVLTSILPAAFAHLERMGYIRDIHYVIGKPPPRSWGLPYQPPVKDYSNYITFYNPKRPVGFFLTSQEREGSGRGVNTDFLLTDETLRLIKERLDNELAPTLRANKDKFRNINWHHGEFHSTSMPYTTESRWILDKGNYYTEEYGIDYFTIWRQVIQLQLGLLKITNAKEFQQHWNEIQRVRKKIKPRLSKDGKTLFTLSNAFDNISNLGLSYIKNQQKQLPETVFMIEIMNDIIVFTSDAFYSLNENQHIYLDSFDDNFANDLAINSGFDFSKLNKNNSLLLNRKYYNPNQPIYLFFDWGGTISFCLAAQFDESKNTLFFIKEFYVLPGENVNMPIDLMREVADYFKQHQNKNIIFVKDSLGDDKSRSIQTSRTINEDAIRKLQKNTWAVSVKNHPYKEPPYLVKWRLLQRVMSEKESNLFKIKIDGNNCKYLVIAMRQTRTRQVGNKLEKDKRMERKSNADQRTAPHATDAFDKGCYWFYNKANDFSYIDSSIN